MKIKKINTIIVLSIIIWTFSPQFAIATSNPGQIYEGEESIVYRNVTVYAPAVASTAEGYFGVISTITVTIQSNGSGRVFVDTLPLTEVDMQGSARLAVKVASALVENDINCNVDPSTYDYFFVVRTSSPIIGGPSAGAIMTVATISLLEDWQLDNTTIMTGMINPDGSIGPIGGIPQKIDAAYSVGATHFLIPFGQGTYTEMVTTIEESNGWPITITRPVTRNIAEYAMDNYGMAVTEVADINEALQNFTGNRFFFNETDGQITTEDYIESMKPLATALLEDARMAFENASSKSDNTSIPYYPSYYREEINSRLSIAEETLTQSEEWYEQGLYYSSTSKSFNSLINSRFILYACDFFDTEDDEFFDNLLDEVDSHLSNASENARGSEVSGFISLQSVGAGQRRASEAKSTLDTARSAYQNSNSYTFDVMEFLYQLAFVVERSNSVGWWLNIGSYFNETGDLNNETLENLALEYIEEAQQAAVYSSIILDKMGTTSGDSANYLSHAEELLTTARDDLEMSYPAGALMKALEATVRANLAIEIIGSEPEDKIDLARESASNKIANSRQQGIEPVLAISYYEYGESLANETVYESALLYYKYSGMIAGALSFTNITTGAASSRYVGIPEIQRPSSFNWLFENIGIILSIIVLAAIAGIGIGLIIAGVTSGKEKDKEVSHKKLTPKNIDDYRGKPKHPYFSKEDMPRSIRDYYKKNK
jgi:uncharacterized protein